MRRVGCMKGKCVRACSVIVGKHLTHREKCSNCQAHAPLKPQRTVNTCPASSPLVVRCGSASESQSADSSLALAQSVDFYLS